MGFELGEGEIEGTDPRFVSVTDRDFRLQPDSPAIDGGVDLGYSLDFEDNPVPHGAAPDLGAFEHHAY